VASLIVTLVGPDRPGLVSTLSAAVTAAGGNWQESRMARLAGQFAGIVLMSLPAEATASLAAAVATLEAEGFQVAVRGGAAEAVAADDAVLDLAVVGQDRPGIVRDIAEILARRGVNIEELTTHVLSGSFSGEIMFRATARLRVPATLTAADISADLQHLSHELMVDIAAVAPDAGS
jgi:glycine cleavage system regulatory protein